MKAILFGLAAGGAFQAWRNYPPDGLLTATSAFLLSLVGIVLAFLVGRSRRGGSATAVAVASAESTSAAAAQSAATVNVFNVQAGHGAAPANLSVPADELPWLADAPRTLTARDLEVMDMGTILDEQRATTLDD